MDIRKARNPFFLLFLIGTPVWATPPNGSRFAIEALEKIKKNIPLLQMSPDELKLNRGWELPFTIAPVEMFFAAPLTVTQTGADWADRVENSPQIETLFALSADILGDAPETHVSKNAGSLAPLPKDIPAAWRPLLNDLYFAVMVTQPRLNTAIDTVPESARQDFMSLYDWPVDSSGTVQQEISSRRIKAQYAGMSAFPQARVLTLSRVLIKSIDRLLPAIADAPSLNKPIRWETPLGTFLINGTGDDIYQNDDLKNVTVLIDLGGKNSYKTPVAAARAKEIRIAIDLGTDVTIENPANDAPTAGSGAFGIGLMYLPNPNGVKTIAASSFSEGYGIGGVGALFARGECHLTANRYAQGAGVFGVGILSIDGSSNTLSANRLAQGMGSVRGVGIMRVAGNNTVIKGGLIDPDPREPLGAVSLCQGVGNGHRAYAGGGVGIAVVIGDRADVQGSYFAQGVGYWHSFGVFRLKGNQGHLQARRYDLGTGVHYAFGHFDLYGDSNTVHNWGVGPNYGWDHAFASALVRGDRNEFQTDWGAGRSAIGSHSIGFYQGRENLFRLGDFGRSHFQRNEWSTSLQIIEGENNQFQYPLERRFSQTYFSQNSAWGGFLMTGGVFRKSLGLKAPTWPALAREAALKRETINLQSHIDAAETKPVSDRITDLIDVAAAFSLDKQSPRVALGKLLSLAPADVPALIDALEPMATDQLIQLQFAISGHGQAAVNAIFDRFDNYSLQKKTLLLNLLSYQRPSLVLDRLLTIARNPKEDALIRRTALRVMANILNKDSGEEPGGRAFYTELDNYFSHPSSVQKKNATQKFFLKARLTDVLGLMSGWNRPGEEKVELLNAMGPDITNQIEPGTVNVFLKNMELVQTMKDDLRLEMNTYTRAEPKVRTLLLELIKSTAPADQLSAIIGIGQLSDPSDAPLVSTYFASAQAVVRESAAAALARQGQSGVTQLNRLFDNGDVRTRQLVIKSLQYALTDEIIPLIHKGLADSDARVRQATLVMLLSPPEALSKHKSALNKKAQRTLKWETDPSVTLLRDQLN